MLSLPMLRRARPARTIEDIPNELLVAIFERCEPVTCARSRAVCRRWRTVVDGMNERKEVVGSGQARLYVCDRRRAILEKYTSLPSCSNTVEELTTNRKSDYFADCCAHTVLTDWTFRFDLKDWTRDFDITEVWLQNFGSFLERDPTAQISLPDSGTSFTSTERTTSTSSNSLRNLSGSASSDSSSSPGYQSGSANSGGSSQRAVPYDLLPSSQRASYSRSAHSNARLSQEVCSELTRISAGRFEMLAKQLVQIAPLHVVFNDHSLYQKRHPLLLFWFLKMLPNLRRLTLDCVQGSEPVELHKVFSVVGIDELTVIQPESAACIIANGGLLEALLNVEAAQRRRFKLRITGRTDIKAHALCEFIRKWSDRPDVVPFRCILIDASHVRPQEFMEAAQYLGFYQVSRNRNEAVFNGKRVQFLHCKQKASINYKCEDGYLVFTYFNRDDAHHFTVKTVRPPVSNVVSFYPPADRSRESQEEYVPMRRPRRRLSLLGPNQPEDVNLLRRIFSLVVGRNYA